MPQPVLINCTFCGNKQVPRGIEDVFPLWLARKLAYHAQQHHPGTPADYKDYSYINLAALQADQPDSIRPVGAVPKPYKLPDVCTTCNNGWMARLEQATNLVAEGLLRGQPKPMAGYDQLVLATWAVKTCLTYDAARDPRLISEDIGTRRFHRIPIPFENTHVLIGHDPHHTPDGSLAHRRSWEKGEVRILPNAAFPMNMALFAFQFDCLILKARIQYGQDLSVFGPRLTVNPANSPYFQQIWPLVEQITWPSSAALI